MTLPFVPDVRQWPVQRYPVTEQAIEAIYFIQLLLISIVINRQKGTSSLFTDTFLFCFCLDQFVVMPVYFYTISFDNVAFL
jgi:hypothetical protein